MTASRPPGTLLLAGLALSLLAGSLSPDAGGQTSLTQQADKLIPPDVDVIDRLGWSVAAGGDLAAVGAPGEDSRGEVFLFTRQDGAWALRSRLRPDEGEDDDQFGFSLALSGDTLAVGAPSASPDGRLNAGAVYVYARRGQVWEQAARLAPAGLQPRDQFGFAVALDGGTLAAGALLGDSPGRPDAGAVYVFRQNGEAWEQDARLSAPDGQAYDFFGSAVAVRGDTLLAGSPNADPFGRSNAGAVYVFERQAAGWSQGIRLLARAGAAYDFLGDSVALGSGLAAAGATGADPNGQRDAGAVIVFALQNGQWEQAAELAAPDARPGDFLGSALGLSGLALAVGAGGADAGGLLDAGAVYVFTRQDQGWRQLARLGASDASPGSFFGLSVALGGSTLMAGAPGIGRGGQGAHDRLGAAYALPAPAEASAP